MTTGAAEEGRAVLAHHGRSFNWAGRFLTGPTLDRAARLYAFCRYIDDLADENPDVEAAARDLDEVCADLRRGASDRADVAGFFDLTGGDPRALAGALLLTETVRQDLHPIRIESKQALHVYSLGVAGSVGLMMCPILRVDEVDRAIPFAIDLGMAMQMTNIARDVLEDAHRDRVYLPAEWTAGQIDPSDIAANRDRARERAWPAVLRLLDEADAYYTSARGGLCFLPLRARAAIHVASRVYRGIGSVIRSRGPARYWQGRAYTTRAHKVLLTAQALGGLALLPSRKRACHDGALHGAIAPTLAAHGVCGG